MNCKRMLVPVDFSEEADLAVRWAVHLSKQESGATLFLLHVLPYIVDPMYSIGWTDDPAGLRWDQAEANLIRWREKVPSPISCVPIVGQGRVASEIERVCTEKAVDMVIMTTRERRRLARPAHLNISEEAARLAPCPVLVLHLNTEIKALATKSA